MQTTFTINTTGAGLYEFTDDVARWVAEEGIVTLFVQHTSASLLIQENANAEVKDDLQEFFHRLVPQTTDPSMYYLQHTYEGPDDMPAHIKASILGPFLQIPITNGELNLGTWQGIYLCEHRNYGGNRKLVLTAWGN